MSRLFFILCLFCSSHATAQEISLQLLIDDSDLSLRLQNELPTENSFSSVDEMNIWLADLVQSISLMGYIDIVISKPIRVADDNFIVSISPGLLYENLVIIPKSLELVELIAGVTLSQKRDSISLSFADFTEMKEKVLSLSADRGRPFDQLKTEKITAQDSTIYLHLNLILSEVRRIDRIRYLGYEKFPKNFVEKSGIVSEGSLYSERRIRELSELIQRLPFVEESKSPEVLFESDSTVLYIYIKKRPVNYFDGLLGLSTEETGKLLITGYLDLNLLNNFNAGERLNINYRADGMQQRRLNAELEIPYIFNSRFGPKGSIEFFRRDSTFQTSRLSGGTQYILNSRLQFGLSFEDFSSTNLSEQIFADPDLDGQFIVVDFLYGDRYSAGAFLNDLFSLKGNFGLGRRNYSDTSVSQEKALIKMKVGIPVFNPLSVNLSIEAAGLFSPEYFTSELYKLGGPESIRGFLPESIDASKYVSFTSEIRYGLNENIYIHSILDAALVDNEVSGGLNKLFGVGAGIGLKSRLGVLKINFANGLIQGAPFRFSNTISHINLIANF